MLEAIIDGVSSLEKRLCIAETPDIPMPERDIETKEIRGRNGSLTRKYGYKDISFPVFFNLLEQDGIKDIVRHIKPWVVNAKELSFSDDSDFYYKVSHVSIPNIENTLNLYGYFEGRFTCKPFQYKRTEVITVNSPTQIMYYGTIEGEPFIKVYGTGDISITINSRTFHLKGLTEYIEIDSESNLIYQGSAPMGNKMIGKLPYLDIGVNNISWMGNVTKIEIDKREAYL